MLKNCNGKTLRLMVKLQQRNQHTFRSNSRLLRLSQRSMSTNGGPTRLKNKITIVTGAGGRLGHAVCLAFEKEGATVIAVDKNEKRLNHLKQKVVK